MFHFYSQVGFGFYLKNCQLGGKTWFFWLVPIILTSFASCQTQVWCCPFLLSWCTTFGLFRLILDSCWVRDYEFYSILITITRTVYLHLVYRTQAKAGDNTLQICWFYRGRYVFCLGLLQLHWVMDFHSDQKLDPLHLQDKKN